MSTHILMERGRRSKANGVLVQVYLAPAAAAVGGIACGRTGLLPLPDSCQHANCCSGMAILKMIGTQIARNRTNEAAKYLCSEVETFLVI